jgi:hypothetical protein
MVVVVSYRHTVVVVICSLPWVMESSMVVVGSCRHTVVEEICSQL